MKWESKEKHTPTKEGLYVVAKFNSQTNEMEWFSTDWCCLDKYFGPNSASYCGPHDYTHWMTYASYRKILQKTPRE